MRRDKTSKLPFFFDLTRRHDAVRDEKTVEVFPEWKELFDKYEKVKA